MKFLEGHDIHVLCESPSAWHLLDGYGMRLPGPAPANQSLRSQFNVRMLTVLDQSLTVVQLIQVLIGLSLCDNHNRQQLTYLLTYLCCKPMLSDICLRR